MEAGANDEPSFNSDTRPLDKRCTNNEDVIANEVRYAVKDLVAKELSTLIEDMLHDVLQKWLHDALGCTRSVV